MDDFGGNEFLQTPQNTTSLLKSYDWLKYSRKLSINEIGYSGELGYLHS